MRIFLDLPGDAPIEGVIIRACDILHINKIYSARPGGFVNDRPVVLVDDSEAAQAVIVLEKAGIKAVTG